MIESMSVTSYATFDEMMEALRAAEEAANERVTPAQASVTWGDYWAREFAGDFWIFGHIPTERETEASEREAGADPHELKEATLSLRRDHERGYRFGRAYSVACPDGELGSTHISEMEAKLTRGQFEAARRARWSMERLVSQGERWAIDLVSQHEAGGRDLF